MSAETRRRSPIRLAPWRAVCARCTAPCVPRPQRSSPPSGLGRGSATSLSLGSRWWRCSLAWSRFAWNGVITGRRWSLGFCCWGSQGSCFVWDTSSTSARHGGAGGPAATRLTCAPSEPRWPLGGREPAAGVELVLSVHALPPPQRDGNGRARSREVVDPAYTWRLMGRGEMRVFATSPFRPAPIAHACFWATSPSC